MENEATNTPTPRAGFKIITLKISVRRGGIPVRNEEHAFAYPEKFATRWPDIEEHDFLFSEAETAWRNILRYSISHYPGTLYWSEIGWISVERALAERERTPNTDPPETDPYCGEL